jgi:hypothetical protein
MKTKIEIKSNFGKLLFEFEKENNTVKDTVIEAVKTGADLRGADLRGADLTGADLTGADLTGAHLRGADGNKIKIKKVSVFTGLYDYVVIPFISDDNIHYVKMGCFTRKLSEWQADFWNNDSEFPNDGSLKSNLRLLAFETATKWLELNK